MTAKLFRRVLTATLKCDVMLKDQLIIIAELFKSVLIIGMMREVQDLTKTTL
jgi:hypothetical protein